MRAASVALAVTGWLPLKLRNRSAAAALCSPILFPIGSGIRSNHPCGIGTHESVFWQESEVYFSDKTGTP